ncbi:MAG: Mrp/NBP35 family ATP-binding protein [Bacillota bacterium]|nr:Mrp/NBP35 family ATP-binding protein [Bacillota bacterium]
MSNCDSCSSKGECKSKESCSKVFPKYGKIKNIIGVISGKGGVGKSTVTGILAVKLKAMGFSVGVLDGDVTGPSMPRILGVSEKRAEMINIPGSEEVEFIPVETKSGIKVISLNLLTEEEDQPVIWRGPLITGVLNQMYTDTKWDDLDFLLIDMPPGTGDIALTVMQSLPVDGMVIASIPQDMVTMIVKKVVIMCHKLNIKVLGVVENMSYVKCDNCDRKIKIFSKKDAGEQAEELGAELLQELPIDLDLTESLEKGQLEEYLLETADYEDLVNNFLNKVKL